MSSGAHVELIRQYGDTTEFRVDAGERALDIAMWGDQTWLTAWTLEGDKRIEVAHRPAISADDLVTLFMEVGLAGADAKAAATEIWRDSGRATPTN